MERNSQTWIDYADALAFLGNSLLAPMNQTATIGLDQEFWDAFPSFDDEGVSRAVAACRAYTKDAEQFVAEGGDAVQRESVEYTALFIGPPKPAVAPWETFYRSEGAHVGFGQATFEMRQLLREAGLQVSNENNQYADHAGIELLYLSELCRKAAGEEPRCTDETSAAISSFASERLLVWLPMFSAAIQQARPNGYLANITSLAIALVATLA